MSANKRMSAEEEDNQGLCFVIDIIVCIFIIAIAIVTFGVGLILFLFYIPLSILVHYMIHQDAKKRVVVTEYGMLDEQETVGNKRDSEFLRQRTSETTVVNSQQKQKEVW